MSGINKTRCIEWYEACKCKCRFNISVCNNKQSWNDDKCRCEYKKLIDIGVCDKGFIWNLSNRECECYKSCDFSEYLDYKNCECKKRLVDKFVERISSEQCTENIEETRLVVINLIECSSVKNKCKLYLLLFSIIFTVNIGIGSYFLCFYWYLKKDVTRVTFGTCTRVNNLMNL